MVSAIVALACFFHAGSAEAVRRNAPSNCYRTQPLVLEELSSSFSNPRYRRSATDVLALSNMNQLISSTASLLGGNCQTKIQQAEQQLRAINSFDQILPGGACNPLNSSGTGTGDRTTTVTCSCKVQVKTYAPPAGMETVCAAGSGSTS